MPCLLVLLEEVIEICRVIATASASYCPYWNILGVLSHAEPMINQTVPSEHLSWWPFGMQILYQGRTCNNKLGSKDLLVCRLLLLFHQGLPYVMNIYRRSVSAKAICSTSVVPLTTKSIEVMSRLFENLAGWRSLYGWYGQGWRGLCSAKEWSLAWRARVRRWLGAETDKQIALVARSWAEFHDRPAASLQKLIGMAFRDQ